MKLHLGKFIAPTALCLLLAGCAQTGPPLPPSLELPKPPTDLRASRKGNRVTLNWSEPTLTTDRQSVRYVGPTLVCRSVESEMTECGNPAAMLPAPSVAPQKTSLRAPRTADLHRHSALSHATAGPGRRSHVRRRGLEPQCPRRRIVESRARARRRDSASASRSGRGTDRRWRSAHLDEHRRITECP